MSHPKIKNTITFTDEFSETLNLSNSQIKDIDELTYEFFKAYRFSLDADFNEKRERNEYYESVVQLLSKKQRGQYEKINQEKPLSPDFEVLKFEQICKKYEDLKLTPAKLKELDTILTNVREIVSEEWKRYNLKGKEYLSKHNFYLKLVAENLKGVLLPRELKQLFEIEESERTWLQQVHTERIMALYTTLKLKQKQADSIYDYEENEPSKDFNNEYLSEFEKWELKRSFMNSILNEIQFKEYLEVSKEQEKLYISHFEESNNHIAKELGRLRSRYDYLVKEYLPILSAWRGELEISISKNQNKILEEFRITYYQSLKKNLNNSIKKSLRYNKNYVPNELILLKLKAKIDALIPSIFYLNEEEKEFVGRIPKRLQDLLIKRSLSLKDADRKLHTFSIINFENHGGTYGGGTYVIRKDKNEEDLKFQIMSTLLLNPSMKENIRMSEKFG